MTNTNNWTNLIQAVKIRSDDPENIWHKTLTETPVFDTHVTIPMDSYMLGNVLGMLKRTEDTGDWYYLLVDMIYTGMVRAGLKQLESNSGDIFTIEELEPGNWYTRKK